MYEDNSERLSDYMMLWGYRSVSECVNYLHHDQATTIAAPEEPVIVRQGEANIPLGITYSSLRVTPSGENACAMSCALLGAVLMHCKKNVVSKKSGAADFPQSKIRLAYFLLNHKVFLVSIY